MNFDEKVRFVDGVSLFDENNAASIQPLTNDERVVSDVLSRPDEHLRSRTEVLRQAIEDLKYRSDYGVFLAQSTGRFRLNAVSSNTWTIEIDSGEVTPGLIILPALIPGAVSGGRADATIGLSGARIIDPATPNKYYLGVLGTNDLWIFASTTHTGQRAYADGTDMNDPDVKSIGANNISVLLRPDANLSAHVVEIDTVTGNPTRHISVRYGDGTTIGELITAINNDRTGVAPTGGPSQDGQSWGIADMIRVATTASTSNVLTGANLIDTGAVPLQMQGAADAEDYVIESFVTFFSTAENRLRDGESIAIAFTPGSVEAAPGYGGRRQSIVDRPSNRAGALATYTTSDSLLFNTGRFPERIPGAIPIGKCFENQFVFIDGTVLSCPAWSGSTTHGPWVRLGQNAPFILALAASTGAAMIGTAATSNWNSTASLTAELVADRHVPAGTVQSSLEAIVTQLGKISSGSSPPDSGSRRIGVETIPATSTSPNGGLQPTEGSLFEVLSEYLNEATYGLNARVSQWGHKLRGRVGISKDFPTEAPLGGADHTVGIFDTMGDISTNAITTENRGVGLYYPIEWNASTGTDQILIQEPVDRVGAKNWWLHLSGTAAAARLPYLGSRVPIGVTTTPTGGTSTPVPNIVVTLSGFVPGAGKTDTNGQYYLVGYDTGTVIVNLSRMDGLGFTDPSETTPSVHPDFSTGDFTNAKLTFNSTLLIGSDRAGQKIRSFHAGYAPFMNVAFQDPDTALVEATVVTGTPNPEKRLRISPTLFRYANHAGSRSELTSLGLRFWDASNVLQRDSANILQALDKDALDGNEDGEMVDATVKKSHHHALTYSPRYHQHVIGSDSAEMAAYDPNDGTSLGTSPTVAAIYAVPNTIAGFQHRAVYKFPAGNSYWTDANGTSVVQCQIDMALRSLVNAGASDVLNLTVTYAIQAGYQHNSAWGGSMYYTGSILSYQESSFQYIPTTKYVQARAKETVTIQVPTLPTGANPADYYPFIWVTISSNSAALDAANSTVSMRHLFTASYTI